MIRPATDTTCRICGNPHRGGPATVPFAWQPHLRLGGKAQDTLCDDCWRWALLWSVGQRAAADRLVTGIETPY